jgi:hypothetical protein
MLEMWKGIITLNCVQVLPSQIAVCNFCPSSCCLLAHLSNHADKFWRAVFTFSAFIWRGCLDSFFLTEVFSSPDFLFKPHSALPSVAKSHTAVCSSVGGQNIPAKDEKCYLSMIHLTVAGAGD